jgi:hypothetical protein
MGAGGSGAVAEVQDDGRQAKLEKWVMAAAVSGAMPFACNRGRECRALYGKARRGQSGRSEYSGPGRAVITGIIRVFGGIESIWNWGCKPPDIPRIGSPPG